jgi:YHS domain-containing protein
MLKVLIFIVAGFLLYKLIMGDRKKKMDARQERQEERVEAGEMVKDPICSTYVSTDSDIRVKEDDETLYFCSYECRDEYLRRKQSE